MSTTTTINPAPSDKSKGGNKKAAAFAATAAASAGAGIAGANMVSDIDSTEEVLSEEDLTLEETLEPEAEAGATDGSATSTAGSAAPSSESDTVEPQPITANDTPAQDATGGSASGPAVNTEPTATGTTNVGDNPGDVVNPDEIAEAIISEENIDPNDIDMADVVNFDEIGAVYTVDGENYTAASFHDGAGNDFVMVDVDGDDVFDVIMDAEGNLLAEVPGNISVGDAQEDIEPDDVYLAYDGEMDNVDEYGADSLADDLMA